VCCETGRAQDTPIPATFAIMGAGCSAELLDDDSDSVRNDPIWAPILKNPLGIVLFPNDVSILEGRVPGHNEKFRSRLPLPKEATTDQSPSEVAEEDLPWNHFTHDKTIDVIPDTGYKHLLASYVQEDGTVATYETMEVEWENGSVGAEKVNDEFMRADDFVWGGLPEFAWASAGDRVWVAGRWVFDCGHPRTPTGNPALVKFQTEIHPPRVMVVFRLNHRVALLNTGLEGDGADSERAPSTWLPVTGGGTALPVTEADIFVSGNGGGANDICNLTNRHINIATLSVDDCTSSPPVIPVTDRNYVFDIYPPGTNFDKKQGNGNYRVIPPSSTAALQWKSIDRLRLLPTHSCGKGAGAEIAAPCITVTPILCLIDDNTPAPTQAETTCPQVQPVGLPTRLRVILPFKGSNANVFAQSILLGWDDVPGTQNDNGVQGANRTYVIRLHKLTVLQNGESFLHDGDWRVFADVGGQWRYLSDPNFFDRNANGDNACHGDSLLENGDSAPDCFQFDNHPWIVSAPAGMPIHVAVGGYESDDVDSHFCYQVDNYFTGGDCQVSLLAGFALFRANDDRLGTLEFDLDPNSGYQSIVPGSLTYNVSANGLIFETTKLDDACRKVATVMNVTPECGQDGLQYGVEFTVTPVPPPAAPASSALTIGSPRYTNTNTQTLFVGASTPISVSTNSTSYIGFEYRFMPDGGPPPTYNAFALPFPVHWLLTDFSTGPRQNVPLNGGFSGDGGYTVQYSAEANDCRDLYTCGLAEPRHSVHLVLDTTPPVITIPQPAAIQYPHSAVLTLGYSINDGAGSGVASFKPTMDGSPTLPDGHGLANGQPINLLTELSLGTHVFHIVTADNIGNAGSSSVTFSVIATPGSIQGDVSQFLAAGKIKKQSEAQSLLARLNAAATAWAGGDCKIANKNYQAFITELNAQSGKGIDAAAAHIMTGDAQYLMGHCPN
jgi:hypothetical protein